MKLPRTDGMVFECLMNGTVRDTSGNGYHGTPADIVYEKTERGYQSYRGIFNGSSSEVSVASSPALSVSSAYTFNAVLQMSSLPASGSLYSILNKRETSASAWYELELWNDGWVQKVFVSHADSGGADTYAINYAIPTWRPFLLTVTYDGSTVTFMVDWETVWSVTWATRNPSASNSGVFRMWRNAYSWARWLSGRMQSVRIFNRALSVDEIRDWLEEFLRKLGGASLYPKLADGMVARFDMKGDANDTVGWNDGTVNGATLTTDRFGKANSSYDFDGSNDYISVPAAAFSAGGTNAFSVSAIVKFDSTSGNHGIVMGTTTGTGMLLYYSAPYLVFSKPNVSDLLYTWTPTTADYVRIDAVSDSSGMRLLIDGVEVASNSNTSNWANTTSPFAIGGYMNGGSIQSGWYFDGKIDLVEFRNAEVSNDEAKANTILTAANNVLPYESPGLPEELREGCVLFVPGNVSGSTAYDASGNGNHGTLVNSPGILRSYWRKRVILDGSTQYVSVPDSASMDLMSEVSISAVLRIISPIAYSSVVYKWKDFPLAADVNYAIDLGSDGLTPRFFFTNPAGTYKVFQSSRKLTTGQVQSLTLSHIFWSGSDTEFFIDGVPQGGAWILGTGNESPMSNSHVMQIGAIDGLSSPRLNSEVGDTYVVGKYVSRTKARLFRYSTFTP